MRQNYSTISEHYVFIHNGHYFLTTLRVLDGGLIDCWGTMSKAQFLEHMETGWITIDVPDGTEVRVGEQGFVFTQAKTVLPSGGGFVHKWISKEEFIKDVLNSVDVGRGYESVGSKFRAVWDAYNMDRSDENLDRVREAYFAVPEHKRCYLLGSMDDKDFPIRAALGL